MSTYRGTIVGIKGDGNAVGDNNHVTVLKTEKHFHNHGEPPRSGKDDGSWIIGAVIALVVAIAASCYYFTRYSNAIYVTLEVIAKAEVLAALLAAGFFLYHEAYDLGVKAVVVTIATGAVGFFLSIAANAYPPEIVNFALSQPTFQGFWCGLSPYGRQLALLHTLSAGFIFAPALLLLAGPSLLPAIGIVVEIEVGDSVAALITKLTSWPLIIMGGLMVAVAGYAHSNTGWNTWTNYMQSPPTWPICPAR